MKILAVSDQRLPELQRLDYLRQNYSDCAMVISCGDMEPSYLEFVTSGVNAPLFFVRGNHDERYTAQDYGGQDLHLRYQKYLNVTLAGLEGSVFYNGQNIQYTEVQMTANILRLLPRLLIHKQTHGYGVDYLVTHASPRGIHDRPDKAHQGFQSFLWLMKTAKPRYLIHGHVDIWDRRVATQTFYDQTLVININPKRLLLPDQDYQHALATLR